MAKSIQECVNKMVKIKYPPSEIVNEAKDVDLTKAFCRWL